MPPSQLAEMAGVRPRSLRAFTLAPAAISISPMAVSFLCAAKCSAVSLSCRRREGPRAQEAGGYVGARPADLAAIAT